MSTESVGAQAIMFCVQVSRNSAGRKAICHIIDNISILIDDWYFGLSTPFESTQVMAIIIEASETRGTERKRKKG